MPLQELGGAATLITSAIQSGIMGTSSTVAPRELVSEPSPKMAPVVESPLLRDAWKQHVLPILQIEDKISTIRGYQTAVNHFCDWFSATKSVCAQKDPRSCGPRVIDLEKTPGLLGEFYAFCLTQGEVKTADNKLKNLRAVWRQLFADGYISRPVPEPRTKQIRKQANVEKSKHMPMPASDDEISAMLQATIDLHDELHWPRLGDVEPFQFWFNVLAGCAVHGFRPADLWPLESSSGLGLLWSEVCSDHTPPIDGGSRLKADWEFGWLQFRINKTGQPLLSPLSPHLAWLIQQCRGLDSERVFPLAYLRKYWYASIDRIKEKAGITRDVSLCGQAPSCSFRKAAAVRWKQCVGRSAASFMLGHSVRSGRADDVDGSFSDVTEQHYMGADVLREVVQGFPAVLDSLPQMIRVPR